ncbi:hypothetical protein COCCADRAFT_108044 [Bipolaris zeicola 26-R-13]|uniref:Uncharacterized protein n=1 Tax=Cochliobolus carbonum (strain 26-R-13) TaxID=930089 RepID=W6Y1H0_COCC2|nr:uncharacterized protein COCCADRAFT_108044 [Bipolaris zeicola 26-R-13]EUC28849.1 hypothetical protein COCCADRAFT_108044 [Bipolaris zeicola 26-R-13]
MLDSNCSLLTTPFTFSSATPIIIAPISLYAHLFHMSANRNHRITHFSVLRQKTSSTSRRSKILSQGCSKLGVMKVNNTGTTMTFSKLLGELTIIRLPRSLQDYDLLIMAAVS